jgi:hypothetical protein
LKEYDGKDLLTDESMESVEVFNDLENADKDFEAEERDKLFKEKIDLQKSKKKQGNSFTSPEVYYIEQAQKRQQ